MSNPPEILDVYYDSELVRIDEDFGGWHCNPYNGHCGGCGQCIMAQASYSGHTFKVATKWQRCYRDFFYYPVVVRAHYLYHQLKTKLNRKDDLFL